jgi:hypothetical protein
MNSGIVTALGADSWDLTVLKRVAPEFGFQVGAPRDPLRVAAALLHRGAFGPGIGWRDAIRRLRLTLPEARVITCHGFSDAIDWGELYDLGTFHAIRVPMKEAEVRQSLGFAWAAERRLGAARKPISIQRASELLSEPAWEIRKEAVRYAAG